MLQTAAIRVFSSGTSEGAEKGWDSRGRGRKEEEPKKEESKSDLHKFLDQAFEQWGDKTLWGKLAKYGRESKPGDFTDAEKKDLRGLVKSVGNCKLGYCYMNAQQMAVNAVRDARVKYMEGLVTVHGVPIDHAWVEFNGKTFDPTIADENWKMKQGGTMKRGDYFGVEIPKTEIAKHWLKGKTYSPLSHQWNNDALMKKIWKEGFNGKSKKVD